MDVAPKGYPTPTPAHWAALAGMRFFLSLIVYIGHLGGTIGKTRFTNAWEDLGELAAVLAFFIISGFSIANSIEQRPRGYIVRRVWRIWPTYLFSFFCCTLPAVVLLPRFTNQYPADQTVTWEMVIGNLLMLQGLIVPVLEANAATWTLAIEEWCYLAAPVFRRLRSSLLLVLIVISAVCYANARSWGWVRFAGQTHGVSHLCFVWAWLIGFFFYRHRQSAWAHALLLLLPLWLITGANELGGSRAAFTILAGTLAVAYGGALLRLPETLVEVEGREGKTYRLRASHIEKFLVFLGNVSYPLYIVHYPVFFLMHHLTGNQNHAAYLTSVFMLCVVVYELVDKPNRNRWQKRVPEPARKEEQKPMGINRS